jgi:serine/threonine protein kinase
MINNYFLIFRNNNKTFFDDKNDVKNENNWEQNKEKSVLKIRTQNVQQYNEEKMRLKIKFFNFINFEKIIYLKKIGSGGYGKVFLCSYNNQEVAVKKIEISNEEDMSNVLNTEIKIMKNLKHINLIQYYGHCIKENLVSLVMELCKGGSLYNILKKSNNSNNINNSKNSNDSSLISPKLSLSIKQKIKISLDIASGLNYLHTQTPAIIHRDIKSMNILLLDELIDSSSSPLAKIADLGISKIFESTKSQCLMTQCGTPQWTAPEILRGEPYGIKSDVYSYGILLWEIFSEKIPYCELNLNKIQIAIQVASNVNFRPGLKFLKKDTPEVIVNLIKNCWSDDPKLRPEMWQIKNILLELIINEA